MELPTRGGMGMCQGRVCGPLVARLVDAPGRPPAALFRVRPPIKPIPISAVLEIPADSLIADRPAVEARSREGSGH